MLYEQFDDYSRGADLEKDTRYKNWPRGFDALLTRGWPGQLKYIAKNIFTAIYIVDPASPDAIRLLHETYHQVENQLPVRFGFIFESKKTAEAYAGEVPAEIDVANMNEGEKVNSRCALFLLGIAQSVQTDER